MELHFVLKHKSYLEKKRRVNVQLITFNENKKSKVFFFEQQKKKEKKRVKLKSLFSSIIRKRQ